MVTEAQQKPLIEECNKWYDTLASYREKINKLKNELYYFAPGKTDTEVLLGIEHFHSQFHIQLINIHDLKQAIKAHDRKINFEKVAFNGSANEDSYTRHESLAEELQSLEQTLQGLRQEFNDFLNRAN